MELRNFGLDLLRASAILAVLLFHALHFLASPPDLLVAVFQRGWMGVDLFFVLSGFLIGGQLFDAAARHAGGMFCLRFWTKRWTRTLPLYFVVLIFYVAVKPIVFHAPFNGFTWKFCVFLQNLGVIKDFGQSWSLCVEEQFYFVFPLLGLLVGRRWPGIWLLPVLLSVALRYHAALALTNSAGVVALTPEAYLNVFRFPTLRILDSISIGVFLAATRDTWRRFPPRLRQGLGLAGVVLIGVLGSALTETPGLPYQIAGMYAGIGTAFGLILIAAERLAVKPRGLGFIESLALWSYSAYLWHLPVARFAPLLVAALPWEMQLVSYLAVTLLVSCVSYRLIQRPGMAIRRTILPRLDRRAPASC